MSDDWKTGEAKFLTLHLVNAEVDNDWFTLPEQLMDFIPAYRSLLYLVLSVWDGLTFEKQGESLHYKPDLKLSQDPPWRDEIGQLLSVYFRDDLLSAMPDGTWILGIRYRATPTALADKAAYDREVYP